MKTHLKITGADCREFWGQSEYAYSHQSACGYVREKVTTIAKDVSCFYCKRTPEFKGINKALD